jgi:hypothetical protein
MSIAIESEAHLLRRLSRFLPKISSVPSWADEKAIREELFSVERTRDELSDDGATWNIPGSRTKNGRAHVVPLPPIVRELIASAKPGNLVFTTTGTTPVSGWSRMKGRLDGGDARRRA